MGPRVWAHGMVLLPLYTPEVTVCPSVCACLQRMTHTASPRAAPLPNAGGIVAQLEGLHTPNQLSYMNTKRHACMHNMSKMCHCSDNWFWQSSQQWRAS